MKKRIAIIGGGIAGATLAHGLKRYAAVTVFEKSRGAGGRMSTRKADGFAFDHGTQYFTGRSRPFREFLAPWLKQGVVAAWDGKVITLAKGKDTTDRLWFEPHYVACPGMNHLCKALLADVDVRTSTEVAPLSAARGKEGWVLMDTQQQPLGEFDWMISTAPAPQTARLLSDHLPAEHPLALTTLQGCYAVMLGFAAPWNHSWIGAKCDDSPLGWISVNSSKPARDAAHSCLVLHSTNAWANAHINDDVADAQAILLAEFAALTGIDAAKAEHAASHRWRYALVQNPSKSSFFCDEAAKLAAVGDWSVTSRIEEVWFTSDELAQTIRAML